MIGMSDDSAVSVSYSHHLFVMMIHVFSIER